MKQILTIALITAALSVCHYAGAQTTKAKPKEGQTAVNTTATNGTQNTTASYNATYASQFEMGDPRYSNMAMNYFKDREEAQTDRHADMFADSVTLVLSNGFVVKGKSQLLQGMKEHRAPIANVKTTIAYAISLRATTKDETGVLIAGSLESTAKDGTKEKGDFMHLIVFDKKDQIVYIKQYDAKPAQQ